MPFRLRFAPSIAAQRTWRGTVSHNADLQHLTVGGGGRILAGMSIIVGPCHTINAPSEGSDALTAGTEAWAVWSRRVWSCRQHINTLHAENANTWGKDRFLVCFPGHSNIHRAIGMSAADNIHKRSFFYEPCQCKSRRYLLWTTDFIQGYKFFEINHAFDTDDS